jgi:hypothetical protein
MAEELTIEDLEDAILTNATEAASMTVDGMSVSAKNTRELIEAHRYLMQQQLNVANPPARSGLRFATMIPPGAG